MKTPISVFLLLFSALTLAANNQVDLVKVEDGDTLEVNMAGKKERIQLLGMDAPEDTQNPKLKVDMARSGLTADKLLPLGHEATEYLQALVKPGDKLWLSGDLQQRDRYGRITAEVVMANGLSINVTMVASGYARPLKPKTLDKDLRHRLEQAWKQAGTQKSGLMTSQPETFQAWIKVQK
ncbi:MAG TPA: thermonuclease family protein [Thiolapillus brandeum]|uniref:Thermonuclease family protein n=1 Tax=Thiolapillus brandeum TaxID=1076588 RepID=A0A831NTA4_9GAMM|nr:thermonuclease family protein [Thiolapillus brandeum]